MPNPINQVNEKSQKSEQYILTTVRIYLQIVTVTKMSTVDIIHINADDEFRLDVKALLRTKNLLIKLPIPQK